MCTVQKYRENLRQPESDPLAFNREKIDTERKLKFLSWRVCKHC